LMGYSGMNKKRLFLYFSLYLVITLVALASATLFSSKIIRSFYYEQTRVDLEIRAHLLEDHLAPLFMQGDWQELQARCKVAGLQSRSRLTVIGADGVVAGDSDEHPKRLDNHRSRPEVAGALQGQVSSSIRFSYTLQKNLMYVAIPLLGENGAVAGCLRIAVPLTLIEVPLGDIQSKIAYGTLGLALLVALVTLFISRQISLPILAMRDGASRFAAGDFSEGIPLTGPSELIDLGGALNRMARDLDQQIQTVVSQRNELTAVFNSMVEGVFTVDYKGRLTSINGAACDLLDTSAEQGLGQTILELVRNSDLQLFVQAALHTKTGVEKDLHLTHLARGDRDIQAHGVLLKGGSGDQQQGLIVLHDVTQLRKLESIRRDFVANVSHELKTPITAIQGFVETLLDGGMDDPKHGLEFLRIIHRQSARLSAIIEDLLTLSRIEQGQQNIQLSCSPLQPIIDSVHAACTFKAADLGLVLECHCPEDIRVQVNPPLLELALVNLVDNGLKYSKDKGSQVRVHIRQQDETVFIDVEDDGEGIAPEHQERLFERFYRVDKARSRKQGGTGLGLAIVKHIIQAHHGRIMVQSKPGKGAVFTIALPGCSAGS
ncbi:MAG: ATP-binding protein, partial [Desulfobulbaceae bacterium]|nr:ATP-binding protein [Desulfobulbaceae bacterium]